jgi:hypothetical protein
MRTVKVVVLWFFCIVWGLLLLLFIPRFRLTSPLSGTGTLATLGWAAGEIIGLLIIVFIFAVLLRSALRSTKAK